VRYKDYRRPEIERDLLEMPSRQEVEARPIARDAHVQAWKYMKRGDVWISPDGQTVACAPEDLEFARGLR
jgi:hypothetical protein